MINIIKDIFQNRGMIFRLSFFEFKHEYSGNFLGKFWIIGNPFIQIIVYWIVFGVGIRQGRPVDGIPFLYYLVGGLVPWFFISRGIVKGANSVYSKLNISSKMNFPMGIVPFSTMLSQLYVHVVLLSVLILLIGLGGSLKLNVLALIYSIATAFIFLVSLSYLTSTLVSIARDMNIIINFVVRLLFYMTPIFWVVNENSPYWFLLIVKINPLAYLIGNYRNAILYNSFSDWNKSTIVFWAICFVLMLVGGRVFEQYKSKFVDFK